MPPAAAAYTFRNQPCRHWPPKVCSETRKVSAVDIHAHQLDADAAYKLLTGAVVPRPIAWVTTLSRDKKVNAAPFSTFTYVATLPPMVAFSAGRRAGASKDTANNILETKEFVVNVGDETLIEPIHFSAIEYPPHVSELEELGLRSAPSVAIATPRIAAAPISLECTLHEVIEFGALRSQFFVGEVKVFHVRDGMYEDGKIDTASLRPVARLAGPQYAKLGEIVTMPRLFSTPKSATAPTPLRRPERKKSD